MQVSLIQGDVVMVSAGLKPSKLVAASLLAVAGLVAIFSVSWMLPPHPPQPDFLSTEALEAASQLHTP
jgi:hypothetical protein